MAGLADLFTPEDYDPKAPPLPNRAVPVRPFGELKPLDAGYYRNQPVMDKVSNIGRTLGQAVGFSPAHSRRMGEDTKNLIGFVPGVGDAVGAVEAKEDLLSGNYGKAAIGAGLTAIGLIPGVGDVAAKAGREGLETAVDTLVAAVKPGIKAYHGSPHSFDRFDMSKIGTGEGAQAYGHGLYFAENEKVAQDYRDTLSKSHDLHWDGKPLATRQDYFGVLDPLEETDWRQAKVLDYFAKQRGTTEDRVRGLREYYRGQPDMEAAIDQLEPRMMAKPSGSMYEVNIDADPEQFLDWDKPLSEQPRVRQSLGLPELRPDMTNEEYNAALDALGLRPPSHVNDLSRMTGDDYVSALPKQHGGLAPEERLKQAGIPGIKYLDAGSRGAADGSRNYVVFDENLISIVKKYGLAAAVGAGLISEQMAQQMQAQGEI